MSRPRRSLGWAAVLVLAVGLAGAAPYDIRYAEQRVALYESLGRHAVRIETLGHQPPPYDPSQQIVQDGAGVAVAPGRLVTTAAFLQGADEIRGVRRDGSRFVLRLLVADPEADLALLAFEPGDCPDLASADVAPIPAPDPVTGAAVVFMPTAFVGDATGVREAALVTDDEGVTLLSGAAANGVPAYDLQARLVALSRRPTPERSRTIAVPGGAISRWLAARTPAPAPADGGGEPESTP